MIPIKRVRFYIEGAEYSFAGNEVEEWKVQRPVAFEFPRKATLCFIERIVKELLSPNSRTGHKCGTNCKKTIGVMIGKADANMKESSLVNAVPRKGVR